MTIRAKSESIKNNDFQIGRITIEGKSIIIHDTEKNLIPVFKEIINNAPKGTHIGILVTPSAFLMFDLPEDILQGIKVDSVAPNQLKAIEDIASKTILDFLDKVGKPTLSQLSKIAEFISIGIDGKGKIGRSIRIIELSAIYDLKNGKIIHWTGKFYPTATQAGNLIRFPKINSHFLTLDGKRVMILACHDLNVFHPRGKEKITGWRSDSYNEFLALARKDKPQIVIQHTHLTENPRTWTNGWKGMEKLLPSVESYAGGIRARNEDYLPYELDEICKSTKKGNVYEFTFMV
jgi:hypothetical protein